MRRFKRLQYSVRPFYVVLLLFAIYQLAFYKLMIMNGDHTAHISFAESLFSRGASADDMILVGVYPLFHVSTKLLSLICFNDIYVAGACVLTAANILSVCIMRGILNTVCENKDTIAKYIIDGVSIGYVLFETIAGPLTDGRIYARQCAPNPWHNPTITFSRPVGLIALCLFVIVMKEVEIDSFNHKRTLIGYSIAVLLSVLAKPSFMMVFLPAMGVYVFIWWIRDFKMRSRAVMSIFAAVFPSMAVIVFQALFYHYFYSDTLSPVEIHLGGFSDFTVTEILKVCFATFPIPILALILYRRDIFRGNNEKSFFSQTSYFALIFGIIEMFLLTNGFTGDFSWGYDLSVGVTTMMAIATGLDSKSVKWRLIILMIYAFQVFIGIKYMFMIYYSGGEYWF